MDEEKRLILLDYIYVWECSNHQFKDEDPEEYKRVKQDFDRLLEAAYDFDVEEAGSWLHGFKSYQEYLNSPEWKQKSGDKLASTKGLCELCGEKATQAHHKHYNSKYNEKLEDLESLCDSCHLKRTFG